MELVARLSPRLASLEIKIALESDPILKPSVFALRRPGHARPKHVHQPPHLKCHPLCRKTVALLKGWRTCLATILSALSSVHWMGIHLSDVCLLYSERAASTEVRNAVVNATPTMSPPVTQVGCGFLSLRMHASFHHANSELFLVLKERLALKQPTRF